MNSILPPRSRTNFLRLIRLGLSLQVADEFLEAFRDGDAAEGADAAALEIVERETFVAGAVAAQVLGTVGALDDFGAGGVRVDEVLELAVAFAVGLGEEDVAGAAQVFDGFAQDAAGEQVAVAEGVGLVHKEEVEPALERQVLETVVEDKGVAAEFLDGVGAGLDAVFVHQHDDAGEVAREHEGFVAGDLGIEEDGLAVTDDARRRLGGVGEPIPGFFPEGRCLALVAAGEDGDLAAAVAEGAGKGLDDGGLAGAAHGEVAHHHDEATERLVVQDAFAIKPEPGLRDAAEKPGKRQEEGRVERRRHVLATAENDVDGELFEAGELAL